MADNFKDLKDLKEIESYDDIYEYARAKAAENDAFLGSDLDEEKAKRVEYLQNTARRLTEVTRRIKCKPFMINNRSQNAGVQLIMSDAGFVSTDERLKLLMSALFENADCVTLTALGEGILMSFSILDVWKTHGSIYDRKKKKED